MIVFITFWIHRPAWLNDEHERKNWNWHGTPTIHWDHENPPSIACVAMVSNRVIAWKLERGQKKWLFFAFVPIFSTNSRETLATQLKLLLVACTIAFQIRTRICFNTSFRTCLSHLSALTNIWMSQGSLISGSHILWLFQNTERRASYLYFRRWSAARYSVLSVNELHVLGMASGWLYVVLSVQRRLNFQSRRWPVVR